MPLKNYGVLKGRVTDRRLGSGANPHYQILVVDDQDKWRIAVNVRSQDGSDVEYVVRSRFSHPITEAVANLPVGFHSLDCRPGGHSLDYIRGNVCQWGEFIPLPFNLPGPDNDLNEKLDHYVQRAMADEDACVYAFGQKWGEEPNRDKIFGFKPGRGIHDIHMNQGNDPGHAKDDGVWQDGGLLFQFPSQDQWVAVLLKFHSQANHTDDSTGHRMQIDQGSGPPSDQMQIQVPPSSPLAKFSRAVELPTVGRPDGLVRIVAALVNSTSSPEQETVTLLNTSSQPVSLNGWSLSDQLKHRTPLSGEIGPGEARRFAIARPMQLSNQGGIISLLDSRGLKIHGVYYTREQAAHPGWTIAF
jgi:uncharacterized protein YukJ